MNAQAMAPDGAGGGASRPIALSCRCAPHGTHSRVRCPWPRAGAVCARMRRGGSLCSRVTWLLGRGDNNLMQRYTDPWTPHCGCNSVSIIYRICGRSARTDRPAPRRGRVDVGSRFLDRMLARSAFRLTIYIYMYNTLVQKKACGGLWRLGAVRARGRGPTRPRPGVRA